jgi:general secretion pathway protein G
MRKQRGFTLIELLIVVAIIGIIAAIAIPNLLDAIERAHQKRSVADLQTIATAMQIFETDYSAYPASTSQANVTTALFTAFTDANSSPIIIPDMIQAVPPADGWGVPFQYQTGPGQRADVRITGGQVSPHYIAWSRGSDAVETAGLPDGSASAAAIATKYLADPPVVIGTLQSTCYQTDIVYADSAFLQAPNGKQKRC